MEIKLTYNFKDKTIGFHNSNECNAIYDNRYITIEDGVLIKKQNFDSITIRLILHNSFPKGLFKICNDLIEVEFIKNDLTVPIDFSSAFEECARLNKFDISNVNFPNVTNTSLMFKNCDKLNALNLENLSFENTINADSMFMGCDNLAYVKLCSNVAKSMININNMFCDTSIITIDTSFLTQSIINAEYAFSYCNQLEKINLDFFSEKINVNSILLETNSIIHANRKKFNLIAKKFDEMNAKMKFAIIEI